MNKDAFVLSILKKIESLKEGVISYSTFSKDGYYEISVSDFDMYMKDKRFKILTTAWHKASLALGFKIVFVCGWIPTEKKLVELSEQNNLILNI